jgi:DNA-binding NtrC family response regulator
MTALHLSVIVADDQVSVLDALRLLLGSEGHEVVAVSSPEALLKALGIRQFDAALIDLNYAHDTTSGREGLRLLTRILVLAPTLPVIVMTGWGSPEGRAEALAHGAAAYVEKPWDDRELLNLLASSVRRPGPA